MSKIKQLSRLGILLSLTWSLFSCGIPQPSSLQLSADTQKPHPQNALISNNFRSILLGQLQQTTAANQYDAAALQQISIPVDTTKLNDLFNGLNNSSLATIDETFKKLTLTDIMDPNPNNESTNVNIDDIQNPITFVLITGVMSEFIKYEVYENIFDKYQDSQAAKQWRRLTSEKGADPLLIDSVLDLQNVQGRTGFGRNAVPLNKMLDITSIDDSNGNPKIRFVKLKVSFLSLETLGSLSDTAQNYNRRLTKAFKALGGDLPNLFLVGYSRGGPIALEMLAQARKSQTPWLKNVKGMLAMGGVLYGTSEADAIFAPVVNKQYTNEAQKQVAVINEYLLGSGSQPGLQLIDSSKMLLGLANLKIIFSNTQAYFNAWDALNNKPASQEQGTSTLGIMQKLRAAKGRLDELKKGLARKKTSMDFDSILHNTSSAMFDKFNFNITSFFDVNAYNDNIIRFRAMLTATIVAVKGLSTASRLTWWKENTLPSGLKYYAIGATLDADQGIFQDFITYNSQTESGNTQLNNNINFRANYGFQLNDGAVPLHRAIFWPRITKAISPQNDLDAKLLGIVGTTHYGLALPYALGDKEQASNPYPREALLRAAAIIASMEMKN